MTRGFSGVLVCSSNSWAFICSASRSLMPDNPWEACQHVVIGQLSMLPFVNGAYFLRKPWPVTQLLLCSLCSQPDHSSGSAMLAAWGVEGLEKVLLGFDQGRTALQDDPRTCAYKQGQISPQNHQPLSKCLAECRWP